MGEIIPTVFCMDRRNFVKRFNKVSAVSKKIQVDIADGKFVPAKTIDINSIPSYSRSKLLLEAHLMVKNPEKYIESLRRKGFKKIIFHVEAVNDEDSVLLLTDRITALGMVPVIAVSPETKLTKKILELCSLTKFVLIMGVRPGRENQKFKKSALTKIKKIKAFSKKIIVQVDGGVNEKTAKLLFRAGADILNSGSYVSESKDPRQAIKNLL
ncbi:MAG: ribulose-phosphate 3-epimerase [Candidatus Nanoarchaeia archaeon]